MFILLKGRCRQIGGLSVRSTEIGGEPFVLTIQNQTFYDIDQIFPRNQDELETAALFRMYLSKSLGKKTTLFSCSGGQSF